MRINTDHIDNRPKHWESLPHFRYSGPLKRALAIADFYGFHLIKPITPGEGDTISIGGTEHPEERAAVIRRYFAEGMDTWYQPVQLAYLTKVPYKKERQLKLEVIGTTKASAEALVLHTAWTIANEQHSGTPSIAINSVGGRDAMADYLSEITSYFRSCINDLEPHCREALKQDVFDLLRCQNQRCQDIKRAAPTTLSFLSETSRRHFEEVLEFLEALSVPYEIDHHLVGARNYTARTAFEIRRARDKHYDVLASGERYDYLGRRAGLGKNVPAVGATITLPAASTKDSYRTISSAHSRQPIVFLVQIGTEPKRRLLTIAETLRRENIPVRFILHRERLSTQLHDAEKIGAPYLVIFGQKEYNDNTVLVRNLETRLQEVMPVERLPRYFKRR